MKVLHISNCANNSGWSKQAEMHLLALDSAGVDVTARHINILNNNNSDLHPRVKKLLEKDCSQPDIIIQNVLPSMLEKTGRARCVAYFVCETSNFINTGWQHKMQLVDFIICPCFSNKQSAIDSGVDPKKIHIVPEAIDTSVFNQQYDTHQIRKNFPDKFIFYTIGEFTQRKNIEAIIKAFHTEFSPTEPVELVIKTTPIGFSNPSQEINDRLNAIKRGLKIYNNIERYKRENIICGFSSEAEIYSLHQSCNCFISTSRAEAFNIGLATAMSAGKICIASNHTGQDYVNEKNCFLVKSYENACYGAGDALPDLYTGNESWWETDINSLKECMRDAYEKRDLGLRKQQQAKKDMQAYSLENVGKKYRELLEKLL